MGDPGVQGAPWEPGCPGVPGCPRGSIPNQFFAMPTSPHHSVSGTLKPNVIEQTCFHNKIKSTMTLGNSLDFLSKSKRTVRERAKTKELIWVHLRLPKPLKIDFAIYVQNLSYGTWRGWKNVPSRQYSSRPPYGSQSKPLLIPKHACPPPPCLKDV